ncbi:MAG TPA: phosphatidylcholine/phosphatidylserine synthase [Phycisphaerae bacterium]|nr:phosphatidylcholine/phosphatidylserine synthase [Phycisphaerae bacterium]
MKVISHPDSRSEQRKRRRDRVLKQVAVLPSLATLGNLVCGLGTIYMCLLSMQAVGKDLDAQTLGSPRMESIFPTYLAIAAYLLVGAMFFDGLDGRLARLTRKTSEFGGQLDSLSDIVSFGVAPAILVLCIAHPDNVPALTVAARVYWRAEWVMAAIYVCCAALRLARFNVENVADESAHMGFRGLPSPGAAAALGGLVILHEELLKHVVPPWTTGMIAAFLPPFAMILGLFMVSRFRYVHLVNALLKGRRPFRQVVAFMIVLLVGLVVQFQLTIALAALAYALSGPVLAIHDRLHRGKTGHVAGGLAEVAVVPGPATEATDSQGAAKDAAASESWRIANPG